MNHSWYCCRNVSLLLNIAELLIFLDKEPVVFKVFLVSSSHFTTFLIFFIWPNIPPDWRAWEISTHAAACRTVTTSAHIEIEVSLPFPVQRCRSSYVKPVPGLTHSPWDVIVLIPGQSPSFAHFLFQIPKASPTSQGQKFFWPLVHDKAEKV